MSVTKALQGIIKSRRHNTQQEGSQALKTPNLPLTGDKLTTKKEIAERPSASMELITFLKELKGYLKN